MIIAKIIFIFNVSATMCNIQNKAYPWNPRKYLFYFSLWCYKYFLMISYNSHWSHLFTLQARLHAYPYIEYKERESCAGTTSRAKKAEARGQDGRGRRQALLLGMAVKSVHTSWRDWKCIKLSLLSAKVYALCSVLYGGNAGPLSRLLWLTHTHRNLYQAGQEIMTEI